jgi:hypothetical protein
MFELLLSMLPAGYSATFLRHVVEGWHVVTVTDTEGATLYRGKFRNEGTLDSRLIAILSAASEVGQ